MVKHSVNYLTDEVMQGMVSITINNAIDDKIPTSNGEADVIKLDVTIKDSNHNSKNLLSHLIFVDTNTNSIYGQFVKSVANALRKTDFDSIDLKNLNGTANYYINNKGYPVLTNWKFIIPLNQSEQMIQEYINSQQTTSSQPQVDSFDPWADAEEDD
ncbi:hypothetical protein HNO90_000964 [Staphylococcus hominis]|jgi:hypothetical protein|uniref:hypothetical protein n=1 Tax=Staphylococcus TaxID=1279 RepID=UPI000451F0FD|nr:MULTISPECIES: hypothetical protein [Staphylococcus]MBF2758174.1 hypothetical protein [Staphylococcus haemolyticus]MCG2312662.1 hypothetical protein [Staphylococcus epidermidis]OFM65450.1 hypothetical protein HMPREF2672_04880 [Staphylococcus sp. HMSC068D07]EZT87174.1 hypothetical protein U990_02594 [Staphylococcus aureus 1111001578]MBB4832583.1 hypothetical protein [Staphylococcus hominis]